MGLIMVTLSSCMIMTFRLKCARTIRHISHFCFHLFFFNPRGGKLVVVMDNRMKGMGKRVEGVDQRVMGVNKRYETQIRRLKGFCGSEERNLLDFNASATFFLKRRVATTSAVLEAEHCAVVDGISDGSQQREVLKAVTTIRDKVDCVFEVIKRWELPLEQGSSTPSLKSHNHACLRCFPASEHLIHLL